MNIYVGNLPYSTTDEDLNNLFNAYGAVSSAKVIIDRQSGRSKGFGFVEMDDDNNGSAAIDELNGKDFNGRSLRVSEARPRQEA